MKGTAATDGAASHRPRCTTSRPTGPVQHSRRMLGAWRGFLQADDFSGYAESFRSGVTHAACLVHARRRFAKIVKDAPKGSPPGLAHEAMRFFAEVYRIEGEIAEADPDERWAVRQQQTKPLMAQFQSGWRAMHRRCCRSRRSARRSPTA